MLRIPFIALAIFICGTHYFCYSQDSIKKSAPLQAIRKPSTAVARYKVYKPRTQNADSSALKSPIATKPDSGAPYPAPDKSLRGQYLFLLTKVYHYQQPFVFSFYKNALDTIKLARQQQKDANGKLTIQNKIIDSLKTQITGKDDAIASKIEEVSVLGMQMSLTSYNIIVWGLVILFAGTAIFVVSTSASYRGEAKYRTNLYSDLEDEFKAFKTKANEREKRLARELQTERNKLDELLGGHENEPI